MGRVFKSLGALAAITALGAGAGLYFALRPSSSIVHVAPNTVALNQDAQASVSPIESPQALPANVLLPVPYTDQAPLGDWADKQHTCEEASLVMVDRYLGGDHSGSQIDALTAEAAINQITPWKPAVDLTAEQVGEVATQHLGWLHEVLPASSLNMQQQLALGRPLIVGVRTHGLGNPNYPGYSTHYEQPGWSVSHYLVVVGYDQSGSFVLNDPGITRGHGYSISYDQLMHAIDDLDGAYPSLNSGRVILVLARPANA
jgi:Peptidase_C39 like family